MRFAIVLVHLSKVLRLPRKSDARSYGVLQLSRKIAPATRNSSLQMPTFLKPLQNPPVFAHENAKSLAPATRNDI